jgi:hypothetical protein
LQSKSRDGLFEFFVRPAPYEVQKQNPGDHRNWFIPEKTRLMLEAAGFSRIWQFIHGQPHLRLLWDLRLFDPYPDHSLHFECQK